MNEKVKFILPYIITFVVGAGVFGGLSGFWVSHSANKRITNLKEQNAALSRTNQEIGDLNKQLKDTVDRDAAIKQQLGETIKRQQEDLARANNYLEKAGESNKLAEKHTQGAIDYLDEIIQRYSQD